jgi:hypothetical protein
MSDEPIQALQQSGTIAEIAKALAKAQAKIQTAATATEGQAGPRKYLYADLHSVWQACRAALTENGISVVQSPFAAGASVTVTTLLLHESGEWFRADLTMNAGSATPQAIGSVITYARRYSLAAMVSVAPGDDDDGAEGSKRPPQSGRHEEPPPRERHPDRRPDPPADQKPTPPPPQAQTLEEVFAKLGAKEPWEKLGLCMWVIAATGEGDMPGAMPDVQAREPEFIKLLRDAVKNESEIQNVPMATAMTNILAYGRAEFSSRMEQPKA